ncbi:MAG TPA: ATP-binding protein [Pseudogracilibacillus sp.]|nr:ATP-binding protein [Pseudogracilibacillus sp.]
MSQNKKRSFIPKGFLWRITILNIVVIGLAISLSSLAIFNTACYLLEGMGSLPAQRQQQFNATLYQYLLVFTMAGILLSSVLHFYFTKRLISPIKQLIEATKTLKEGSYPKEIKVTSKDEVGQLVNHYNGLTNRLKESHLQREKLVTNLSHELRTPVANLQGYLYALKTGTIEGDAELFESLYLEAQRLTSMIEQIDQINDLDSIKSESEKPMEKVSIDQIIEETLKMFDLELNNKGVKLLTSLEPYYLMVHKESIKQLVSNLIDNAIKYNLNQKPIEINGRVTDKYYELTIGGTSGNLTEEEQEKLFNRFYRTDPSRNRNTGGTGLGLSIVKDIVDFHQGEFEVINQGDFNQFVIKLPKI